MDGRHQPTRGLLETRRSIARGFAGLAVPPRLRCDPGLPWRGLVLAIALAAVCGPSRVAAEPHSHQAESQPTGQVAALDEQAPTGDESIPGEETLPAEEHSHGEEHWHGEGEVFHDGFAGPPMVEEPFVGGPEWLNPLGDWGGIHGCPHCGACGSCGCAGGFFWGRAEFLYWWVQGSHIPPLVTTSPPGTAVGVAGVLPDATILFGDELLNTEGRPGGRFTLGYWFDLYGMGIEDTFLFLGDRGDSFSATSAGTPILARPFFNTDINAQDALLLAFPDVVVGSVTVDSDSVVFANELNLRRAWYVAGCARLDVLAGYRYFYLGESLTVDTSTTSLDGETAGTAFLIEDRFRTRNHFNGGQLGLKLRQTRHRLMLELAAKLAIGAVSQRVLIDGSTVTTPPGNPPITATGGVLALPSNIGEFDRTQFGLLPEFDVNLAYQLTPHWQVSLGYTAMLLTNVVRPGDQIDLRIDPGQFPPGVPGTFPAFAFHESDLWLQGLNFGVECNY